MPAALLGAGMERYAFFCNFDTILLIDYYFALISVCSLARLHRAADFRSPSRARLFYIYFDEKASTLHKETENY